MRIIDAHVFFLDKILLYFFWHMVMNTDTLGTLNKTMPTLSQGVLLCFVNVSSKFDTRVGMFNISLLAPDPVSLQHSVLKVSSLFPSSLVCFCWSSFQSALSDFSWLKCFSKCIHMWLYHFQHTIFIHPFLYVVVYGIIWKSHMKSEIRTSNAWVLKAKLASYYFSYLSNVTKKLQILSSNTCHLL